MDGGKYLSPADRKRLAWEKRQKRRMRRRKKMQLLLLLAAGNALTVYMIAGGHMEGTFGAGFAAAMSAYFGYQLKGVS